MVLVCCVGGVYVAYVNVFAYVASAIVDGCDVFGVVVIVVVSVVDVDVIDGVAVDVYVGGVGVVGDIDVCVVVVGCSAGGSDVGCGGVTMYVVDVVICVVTVVVGIGVCYFAVVVVVGCIVYVWCCYCCWLW